MPNFLVCPRTRARAEGRTLSFTIDTCNSDIVNLPEVSGVSPYASTNKSSDADVEDRDAAVELLPCVLRENCCSAISYRIILFYIDGVR